MLREKNMPNYFWAEAVATDVYIMNKNPTTAIHGITKDMHIHKALTMRKPLVQLQGWQL